MKQKAPETGPFAVSVVYLGLVGLNFRLIGKEEDVVLNESGKHASSLFLKREGGIDLAACSHFDLGEFLHTNRWVAVGPNLWAEIARGVSLLSQPLPSAHVELYTQSLESTANEILVGAAHLRRPFKIAHFCWILQLQKYQQAPCCGSKEWAIAAYVRNGRAVMQAVWDRRVENEERCVLDFLDAENVTWEGPRQWAIYP